MKKKLTYLGIMTCLITPSFFSVHFGFFQLSIYRAIIILLGILGLMNTIKSGRIEINNNTNNKFSLSFMIIWLVYGIFSLAWVKSYSLWLNNITFLALGVFSVFTINSVIKTKQDLLVAFRLLIPMIIVHNVIGWYEVKTGDYLFLHTDRLFTYVRGNYPVSSFHNTNNFAIFLFFSFFISYTCFASSKSKMLKIMYGTTGLSSLTLIIMTQARAVYIAVIISLIIFVGLSFKNKKTRITTISFISVILILLLVNSESLINYMGIFNRSFRFNFDSQGGSTGIRINLIKNGLNFLIKTLGFGTGAGNIEYWMRNNSYFNTFGVLNIHNWWMEILVAYGIFIFVLYIIFYTKLSISMYKKNIQAKDHENKIISLSMLCILIGYIVGVISVSTSISSEWLWVFWGLCIAYQGITVEY